MKVYYIYMLECSNGAYYTGYTTDIVRRYEEHQAGSEKCKYTRSFPPKRIAACWKLYASLSEALKLEKRIKGLSKSEKNALIKQTTAIIDILKSDDTFSAEITVCKIEKGT